METLKKIILFAFIAAVFITCKKEQLAPSAVVGQPVFSFNGTINGNSLTLQAGINNYYMYSSYNQDSLGVYSFIGNLQNTSTNKNSIQISINDYKISASNASVSSHIDSSLSTTALYYYYKVAASKDTTYSVTFTPKVYDGTPLTYAYTFGDGGTSNVVKPTHLYNSAGKYATSLTIKFSNGFTSTMYDTIIILKIPSQLFPPPQFWVDSIHHSTVVVLAPDSVSVALTATVENGTGPYSYVWNFGDGSPAYSSSSTNTTPSVNHIYTDTTQIYPIYLIVKDASGNSESYNYKVWGNNQPYQGNLFDYTMSVPNPVIVTTTNNSNILSVATINYTDANGNVYTSYNASQPKSSTFKIDSVANYKNNLSNNPTEIVKTTFSCMLYPVLGGTPISATNCTAVIAVAYH